MKVLALDISTKTGWAFFDNGKLVDSGTLEQVRVEDFNVNDNPNHSPKYPWNMLEAAQKIVLKIKKELLRKYGPEMLVVENTVKGRNRHTQRLLEFIHMELLKFVRMENELVGQDASLGFVYMDPSEWRSILNIRMSKEDKNNNKEVKQGKKRGKIGKKHLSVRWANEKFNLGLKLKNEDRADALALGWAYIEKYDSEVK